MAAIKESIKDSALRALGHAPGIRGLHETALGLADDPEDCAEWFQGEARRLVLPILDRVGVEIIGADNIPSNGDLILAPSHVDITDPFAAAHAALRSRPDLVFRFLAKHQLDRPVLDALLNGSVEYIERVKTANQSQEDKRLYNEAKMRALARAIAEVGDGHGAGMIFPWGTREEKGSLPARIGVFLLAGHLARMIDEEVPIVIMGMAGNKLGTCAVRSMYPGSDPSVSVVIPEPVVVQPSFMDYLERGGEHGAHIQPYRDHVRQQLHDATLQAREIVGGRGKFDFLDEPSKKKSKKRVSIATKP